MYVEKHEFETIFTSNDAINIQYKISKRFVNREISYSMGFHAHFGPRRTNIPHETPNYGHEKSKSEVDYYRQTYYSPKIISDTEKK